MTRLHRHIFPYAAAILLTAMSAGFSGCSKKPKGTISEGKMVTLMADMQLAETYSNMEYVGSESGEKREQLGKAILAKNGVTQEELDSTLAWYGHNLDDYTKLFEKVNKEIAKRKKEVLKLDKDEEADQGNMLWPYRKNGTLSPLGNSDSWVVSIDDPELQKGDMLLWKMHLNKPAPAVGVLGVEYDDGTSEAVTSQIAGRPNVEIKMQPDTGKNVTRIYGTLRIKEAHQLPLFADSISLVKLPFDSVEYHRYRSQRKYGIPARQKPKVEEKNDSVKPDLDGHPDDGVVKMNMKTGEIRHHEAQKVGAEVIQPPRGTGGPNPVPSKVKPKVMPKRPVKKPNVK